MMAQLQMRAHFWRQCSQIERQLDSPAPAYDGDMPKLYKRVQKLLNLDPSRPDIEGSLKQILGGLASVVGGLSGVSNRMSDRHVRSYKPTRQHAALAVNSAKPLANFLFETHRYQKEKDSQNPQ